MRTYLVRIRKPLFFKGLFSSAVSYRSHQCVFSRKLYQSSLGLSGKSGGRRHLGLG